MNPTPADLSVPGGPCLLLLASAVEGTVSRVLPQLVVILAAARLAALAFKRLGQPAAVGEIAAGLLLGPSLLGWLAPAATRALFTPEPGEILMVLSQLGLVLLLFLIGLEFDFTHLRLDGGAAALISISGVALPFGLGWAVAHVLHPRVAAGIEFTAFALFMGTAMSITAIPILGRILMELNLSRTRLGTIAIAAAAVDDATGWVLLAACSALVQSRFRLADSALMLGSTIAYGFFLILVLRPLLHRWATWTLGVNGGELTMPALAALLVLIFLSAMVTSKIGIFAIFGAFLLGAVFSAHADFRRAVTRRMGDFVTAFFLPIFFTFTGLRTDVTGLGSVELWLLAGLVSAAAIAGKFGGCALAARLGGMPWRTATAVGVLMNTRALMELIVLNVGYNLGVIPQTVFSMLVLMALLTTAMCTPLLLALLRRDPELRPLLARSEFRAWLGAEPPLAAASPAAAAPPASATASSAASGR
ncbi:MAG: cation:proton antiporter [Planctomycetes bacterium]|nr:cation:proton antiporter [Planctomycetota bacterium]